MVRQLAGVVGTGVGVLVGTGVTVAQFPAGRHAALKTGTQPCAHAPFTGGPQVGRSH